MIEISLYKIRGHSAGFFAAIDAFDKECQFFENAVALRGMEFLFCLPKSNYEVTARNKR